MSKRRDGAVSMHQLSLNRAGRRRGLIVEEVEPSLNTAINQPEFSSERMIRLPACTGGAPTGGQTGSAPPPPTP
jgi:hypothetical protein